MTNEEIIIQHTKVLILREKYRTLSEVCELFPKDSAHRAYLYMQIKMEKILEELERMQK
jgi:hypothetical protein